MFREESVRLGLQRFEPHSLVDAALRVGDVRHCAGFGFEVCNCLQGGVGDCQEREVFSTSWCVVFEGMLSV